MGTRFLQRRGTAAEWVDKNPILGPAEFGIETDTDIIKIGDGVTSWTDLDPAFEGAFLPIDGKAADSDKLDGFNHDAFLKVVDAVANYLSITNAAATYLTIANAASTYVPISDTGWLTTGLSFSPITNWTVNSYKVRKINNRVRGTVDVTYSGSTITADASGNMTDVNGFITMPSGWRITSGYTILLPIWRHGYTPMWGRANTGNVGTIDLVAGSFNAHALTSATPLSVLLDYLID